MPNYQLVPYSADVETTEPDEAATTAELVATMRRISDTTFRDSGHAFRSVHAKCHAILEGELHVCPDLPEALAQGLFARSMTYPIVMRLSTNPGDILPDSVSVPRGLAIKVSGVEGERLPGSEKGTTQDFVFADAPEFIAADAKTFLGSLKLLAATTDKAPRAKQVLSTALRGVETAIEALGAQSPMLKALGGHPMTHPLGETFYSQTPFRHGDYIAKYSVAPASPELQALLKSPLDVRKHPNGLRDAILDFFLNYGGRWEFGVQLCYDLETMPIEDASVAWPQERSAYLTVAEIVVKPQPTWTPARAAIVDDRLSFSPWHGLAAHRPLGSINRARRPAYEMSAGLRSAQAERPCMSNGQPSHLPQ